MAVTLDTIHNKLIEMDRSVTKILGEHEVRITRNEKDNDGLGKKIRGQYRVIFGLFGIIGIAVGVIMAFN